MPLIEEYCYEDYTVLERILGRDLVDTKSQRIREDLFAPDRADDLVTALRKPHPDLVAMEPEAEVPDAESLDETEDGGTEDVG